MQTPVSSLQNEKLIILRYVVVVVAGGARWVSADCCDAMMNAASSRLIANSTTKNYPAAAFIQNFSGRLSPS